jgi:hypothetical protein
MPRGGAGEQTVDLTLGQKLEQTQGLNLPTVRRTTDGPNQLAVELCR